MDIKKSLEILKLTSGASVEELKHAYRDMVDVWHPDRFLHNPRLKEKAEQQLQEINLAYETALEFISAKAKLSEKKHDNDHKSVHQLKKNFYTIPVWLIRYMARGIDGIVFALMIGYIEAFRFFHQITGGIFIFIFAASLLWVFVESNLLSIFGTTPGKWILNIRIVNQHGNKPTLMEAFNRSMAVWWYGLGAGFLPVMMVTLTATWFSMNENSPMRWDLKGRFLVFLGERGYLKTSLAFVILIIAPLLLALLWAEQRA